MDHLAAAEAQGDLHLVAFLDEPLHRPHLDLVIVVIDVRTHLDLFDLDHLLVLPGLVRLLLRLVLVLAVVGDLGDWRDGIWRDLDEIETGLLGHFNRLACAQHTDHVAVFVDQADLRRLDLVVDARTVLGRRALLCGSSYGLLLLCLSPCEGGYETAAAAKGLPYDLALATVSYIGLNRHVYSGAEEPIIPFEQNVGLRDVLAENMTKSGVLANYSDQKKQEIYEFLVIFGGLTYQLCDKARKEKNAEELKNCKLASAQNLKFMGIEP